MVKMKKYKVELAQIETFIIDVLAKNETEAKDLALAELPKKASESWRYSTQDLDVKVMTIYNVTGTDDPFNPSN